MPRTFTPCSPVACCYTLPAAGKLVLSRAWWSANCSKHTTDQLIDAEQGLCNGRASVRPSVCPIYQQQQRRPAGVLPSAPPAGTRYRSIVASAQQQGRCRSTAHSSSTVISSKCEQCHVYSRRRRLNSERRLVSHCVALDAGNDWSSDGELDRSEAKSDKKNEYWMARSNMSRSIRSIGSLGRRSMTIDVIQRLLDV